MNTLNATKLSNGTVIIGHNSGVQIRPDGMVTLNGKDVAKLPKEYRPRKPKKINHKWHDDICLNCEVQREKRSHKILMAIHQGKNIYQYVSKYVYLTGGIESFTRPNCWRTTFDD